MNWSRQSLLTLSTLAGLLILLLSPRAQAQNFPIQQGDRILVTGNTFAERLAQSGYFEAALQAAFPDADLTIWQLPWSGDEVGIRPREAGVPSIEDHVRNLKPTVLVLCYGMSESFQGRTGVDAFRNGLTQHMQNLRSLAGGDVRVIIVSPIAHEDLGSPLPSGVQVDMHNQDLSLYVNAARQVAAGNNASFVDLFNLDPTSNPPAPRTTNGIHPSEAGCAYYTRELGIQLGWWSRTVDSPDASALDMAHALRALACDKHWLVRLWYRPTNTAYVWGGRHEPFGSVNFPPEMAQLRRMIDARAKLMNDMDKPSAQAVLTQIGAIPMWESIPTDQVLPEDQWEPAPVVAKGTETSLGSLTINPPDEFIKSFTLPEGYEISCFVSEEDFAEMGNPVQLTFDNRHRLWVMVMPTYPHLLPGERPRDKLLVLEDTDGDGHADKQTIFADGLYIPTGFAVDADGTVYVGQSPDLLRLRDTDGDGHADRREIIASGFAMPDSHHQLGAFEWDPSGAFLFHEGVFCRANVETPWGTIRTWDAAVWRFDPRIGRLEVMSHSGYANPWGHVFDDYGQSILADASGGDNFDFSHVISPFRYPNKPAKPARMLKRGRPTAGCEIIGSRQFPDEVQGSFLVNQCIGFHGTRWDMLSRQGSTWATRNMPMDLVSSSDTNFRPVALEIGPDGTLYIVDWCNPLIGHMQYSVRDPRRDHTHGRIWRVRYKDRPLVNKPDIADADVPALLELLRIPETNTRQLVRRRLQTLPVAKVEPDLRSWFKTIPDTDPLASRLKLDALWILSGLGIDDTDLLEQVLCVNEPEARAAAARVIRYWLIEGRISQAHASGLLRKAIDDDSQIVRLEALVACGFLGTPEAVQIAARASGQEMDDPMRVVFGEVISYLGGESGVVSDVVARVNYERMPADQLELEQITPIVAEVMLSRPEVSLDLRSRALDRLAGFQIGDRGKVLVGLLETAHDSEAARSLLQLILAQPADELAVSRSRLSALVSNEKSAAAARTAALAALISSAPDVAESLSVSAFQLLEAASKVPAGPAPNWVIERLRTGVESGELHPSSALEHISKLARDRAPVVSWLKELVDRAAETGFDQWGPEHVAGMAALRTLNLNQEQIEGEYALKPAPTELLELGRAVYHDETRGCVRCHGPNGRGLEGFPPLVESPLLLGNPLRPASIVIGGLHGKVHIPDGRVFDSVMEPLGSVMSDEEIAAALTFARQSWGNYAPAVTTQTVSHARSESTSSTWNIEALELLYPLSADRFGRSHEASFTEESTGGAASSAIGAALMSLAILLVPALVVAGIGMATGNRSDQP